MHARAVATFARLKAMLPNRRRLDPFPIHNHVFLDWNCSLSLCRHTYAVGHEFTQFIAPSYNIVLIDLSRCEHIAEYPDEQE
jgi:hypothetical protein